MARSYVWYQKVMMLPLGTCAPDVWLHWGRDQGTTACGCREIQYGQDARRGIDQGETTLLLFRESSKKRQNVIPPLELDKIREYSSQIDPFQ